MPASDGTRYRLIAAHPLGGSTASSSRMRADGRRRHSLRQMCTQAAVGLACWAVANLEAVEIGAYIHCGVESFCCKWGSHVKVGNLVLHREAEDAEADSVGVVGRVKAGDVDERHVELPSSALVLEVLDVCDPPRDQKFRAEATLPCSLHGDEVISVGTADQRRVCDVELLQLCDEPHAPLCQLWSAQHVDGRGNRQHIPHAAVLQREALQARWAREGAQRRQEAILRLGPRERSHGCALRCSFCASRI
eukprot:5295039-Prymnesium_polylepis.1